MLASAIGASVAMSALTKRASGAPLVAKAFQVRCRRLASSEHRPLVTPRISRAESTQWTDACALDDSGQRIARIAASCASLIALALRSEAATWPLVATQILRAASCILPNRSDSRTYVRQACCVSLFQPHTPGENSALSLSVGLCACCQVQACRGAQIIFGIVAAQCATWFDARNVKYVSRRSNSSCSHCTARFKPDPATCGVPI